MSKNDIGSLNDISMTDLFRREVEAQSAILTEGLLAIERDAGAKHKIEELMRAAHSLKGAARIVGCDAAVSVAHATEDRLVAAQKGINELSATAIDALLAGVDLLSRIASVPEEQFHGWAIEHQGELDSFIRSLSGESETDRPRSQRLAAQDGISSEKRTSEWASASANSVPRQIVDDHATKPSLASERVLRITADNLNRLLGLAGETLVASRWLDKFVVDLLRMKQLHRELTTCSDKLRECLGHAQLDSRSARRFGELRERMAGCQRYLLDQVAEIDRFSGRFASYSTRLYQEVLDCRMRPFSEGIQVFPRMVRDLGRSLGKNVKLEVTGASTTVDREILERIKAPLDHLLRNAIDHGIELPAERRQLGKPEEGTLSLGATHSAGKLVISVIDDGHGIEVETIREAVAKRNLTSAETAARMSEAELMEFLFLPGFSLKDSVSEISGRGIGLDVVHAMVKDVGGSVRVFSQRGEGTRFQLELPLTLSVIRTLLVEIGGEPYAYPLARVDGAVKLKIQEIQSVEGRQHFSFQGEQVGIISASQVLELAPGAPESEISVIVLGSKGARYGLLVDRFLGERELVVRALDPRLGKLKNISSAALMPDGSPVLIVDVDDLIREIEKHVAGDVQLSRVGESAEKKQIQKQKRVLVVDDSLTVRELERKLLESCGYDVDIAVNGMDGWNAVRTGQYDLVLTDVDMPRLDGIELLSLIRKDNRLRSVPVMIVSYKDRPEDRERGLEAGADYYLTKGSFQDQTFIRAVSDLIGGASL